MKGARLSLDFGAILSIVLDLLIIGCVVFLGWDPARMIAYYFLEFNCTFLALTIYMAFIRKIHSPGAAMAGIIFIFVVSGYISVGFLRLTGNYALSLSSITQFYQPYYELTLFLTFMFIRQATLIKQHLDLEVEQGTASFKFYTASVAFLVPVIAGFGYLLHLIIPDIRICMIICLLVMRQTILFLHKKRIRSISI